MRTTDIRRKADACAVLLCAAAFMTNSVMADKKTNTFTRTSSQAASIGWSASGVPNDYGTESGLDVSLEISYDQDARTFQALELPAFPIYVDSVIGGEFHNLVISNSVKKYAIVNDPTPFTGIWSLKDASGASKSCGLFLPDNGGAGARTVGSAHVRGRFQLGIAAGCEAFLDYPFGLGMFEVNRATGIGTLSPSLPAPKGKLTVNRSPGPYSVALVGAGTLGIVGGENDATSPVPGAWARFDVSNESSFSFDGWGVTEWRDADGRPVTASVEASNYNHPQRELDEVTGKTLVNFGNRGGVTTAGAGSRLKFPEAKDGISEMFVVMREIDDSSNVHPAHLFGNAFPRHSSSACRLFRPWESLPKELAMGEIRLNGQAVVPDAVYDFMYDLTVISAGYRSGGGSVLYIGGTEGSTSGGGAKIAEILFYTNTLTSAERRRNNDYLMKKWRGSVVHDYGAIILTKGASLTVESGTAHVRELDLNTNGFVKAGMGSLAIGSINRNLDVLAVSGGTVGFAKSLARPDSPQPAANPLAWFAADDEGAFDTVVSNYTDWAGTCAPTSYTFVTSWKDKRRNGYTLARPTPGKQKNYANGADAAAWPTLDTTTLTKPIVDLGPWTKPASGNFGWIAGTSGLSTFLRLYQDGSTYDSWATRQGFIVFYKTDKRAVTINSTQWSLRNTYPDSGFTTEDHAGGAALGGHWTYDGVTVNPASISLPADGKAHLGSFMLGDISNGTGIPVNIFGADMGVGPDGGAGGSSGGCKIAEIILYNRYLTEQERVDTERYLMEKWNCGTHIVDRVPYIGKVSFADGVPAVIDTDIDISFGRMECESSPTLVKRGTGNATVGSLDPNAQNIAALALEGGSLSITSNVAIANGAIIDVHSDSEGRIASASIDGTLTVGGTATVRLHVPNGTTLAYGESDIIAATSISVDGATAPFRWALDDSDGAHIGSAKASLVSSRNAIVLRVYANGLYTIVR